MSLCTSLQDVKYDLQVLKACNDRQIITMSEFFNYIVKAQFKAIFRALLSSFCSMH
jgi:hypothetical protein